MLYDNQNNVKKLENHGNRPEVESAFDKGTGDSVSTSTRNGRSMAGSGRSGALCRPPAKAVSFMSSPPVLLLYAMLLLAIRILS